MYSCAFPSFKYTFLFTCTSFFHHLKKLFYFPVFITSLIFPFTFQRQLNWTWECNKVSIQEWRKCYYQRKFSKGEAKIFMFLEWTRLQCFLRKVRLWCLHRLAWVLLVFLLCYFLYMLFSLIYSLMIVSHVMLFS